MKKLSVKGLKTALLVLGAIAYALVFYAFTTPVGPSIGSDNAIFMTMGTALAKGYAPYTQIFDHKGPVVFLLQWLPQALSGGYSTLAIFVQQVIFAVAMVLLTDRTAQEMGAPGWTASLVYVTLICSLVGGGNLTEEYTNVFTMTGILMMVRCFGGKRQASGRKLAVSSAVLGAMTALCFLARPNNAFVLGMMTLALTLWLVIERDFARLGVCALGFAGGLALVFVPIMLWLLSRGALSQAFYGTIIHNMLYSETAGASRMDMLLHEPYGHMALLMFVLAVGGALMYHVRTDRSALALAMIFGATGALAGAFISHKFYDHYLVLGAPLAALGAAVYFDLHWENARRKGDGVRWISVALLIAVMIVCGGRLVRKGLITNDWRESERADWVQFTEDAQALYSLVPEDERDEFMAYRVEPRWYVAAEALPCVRFYFLQETLAQADPAVMDEIVETFETNPPRWLVIFYNREFGPPYDERMAEIMETRYEFVDSRGTYQLRKLKE